MASIADLIESHKERTKQCRYEPNSELFTDVVCPPIFQLIQAEHSKGMAEQSP